MKLSHTHALAGLSAAAIACATGASAAPGQAAFAAFRGVCGGTRGDFAAVQDASQAQGWKNTEVLATPMNGVTLTSQLSRLKQVEGEDLTLLATQGTTKSGVNVSTCTVYADKDDLAGATSAARNWLGFAPQGGADAAVFHFTSKGSRFQPVADADIDTAAASPEGVRILQVKLDNGKTVIDEIKIRK